MHACARRLILDPRLKTSVTDSAPVIALLREVPAGAQTENVLPYLAAPRTEMVDPMLLKSNTEKDPLNRAKDLILRLLPRCTHSLTLRSVCISK